MSCSLVLKAVKLSSSKEVLCQNISLHVGHKEKIAIVGPNGAGKTTLLESIAGLHMVEAGEIEVFHKPIKALQDYNSIRPMVGYLFQNSDNQFLAPKVLDDVAFSLLSGGERKEVAFEKALMMLEELEIAHLKDKIVYHLSGGEKKLVALAGVLVTEPKLLLLDEPTTGLDLSMQLRLVAILKNIDKSIIIVSHDTNFIDSVVDKSYEMLPEGLKSVD